MSIIVNTVAAALVAGSLSGPILADIDPGDAVRQGLARPLGQILGAVQGQCPGQFLDARLRKGRGGLVYHIKLKRPGGKRATLAVDALSGQIIGGRC